MKSNKKVMPASVVDLTAASTKKYGERMRLGKLFNTEINFHWSSAVLVFFTMRSVMAYLDVGFVWALIASFAFSMGLILSIIAHEFGHILVGRKYGVDFTSITLHALGGAAHMDRNIPSAKSELMMAAAGPAVSAVLGILLGIVAVLVNALFPLHTTVFDILGMLAISNIGLAIFNLIPAYPLDGGRILRSTIWIFVKDFIKATQIATYIGNFFGGLFILSGILMAFGIKILFFGAGISSGIWNVVLGAIIILAANSELKQYKEDFNR